MCTRQQQAVQTACLVIYRTTARSRTLVVLLIESTSADRGNLAAPEHETALGGLGFVWLAYLAMPGIASSVRARKTLLKLLAAVHRPVDRQFEFNPFAGAVLQSTVCTGIIVLHGAAIPPRTWANRGIFAYGLAQPCPAQRVISA
jgi:hypothetical protein